MFRSKPTAPLHHPRKLIATALILAFHAGAVLAGPTARIDIPAQPLSSALRALASQAGIQLVFTPETVGAGNGRAIKGEMSAEDALRQLLAGSGLEFRQDGERNYVVVRPARAEHNMAEMVVTATRTERRVEDVPASVGVVTSRDIARQQPVRVEDVLKNVEGVDVNSGPASGWAGTIFVRGVGGSFAGQTSQVLVDGIATDSLVSAVAGRGGLNFTAAQDIERIEILRGPASALYGPGVVGGIVNVIPKRWSGGPGAEVQVGIGAHNARSLGAAVGTANDILDVRFSAADFKTDGFKSVPDRTADTAGIDLAGKDWSEHKLNLQLGMRPSDHQELTLSAQSYRGDGAWLGGHPYALTKSEGDTATLGYRHEFGDTATVKLTYRKSKVLLDTTFDMDTDNNDGDLSPNYSYGRFSDSDSLDGQLDMRLARNNTLTVGFTHATGEHATILRNAARAVTRTDVTKSAMTGVFVQDEHGFTDALTLIAGGRQDRIRLHGDTRNGATRYPESTDSVFNPRMGLRYRFSSATSAYASYGTAYVPALNYLKSSGGLASWRDNPSLKPETSATYEVGMNHKLGWGNVRAAIFHTDYTDKISSIIVATGPTVRQYQNIGKVAVDGIELGLDARLAGGWQPYANYALTDSIIKKNPGDTTLEGKRLQRVAPQKLNFGVVYAPGTSWDARIGGRYVDEIFFNDNNNSKQRAGGYFVADAKVSARLPIPGAADKWEAYLAVNNLFDRKYATYWQYEYADRRNAWIGVNGKF